MNGKEMPEGHRRIIEALARNDSGLAAKAKEIYFEPKGKQDPFESYALASAERDALSLSLAVPGEKISINPEDAIAFLARNNPVIKQRALEIMKEEPGLNPIRYVVRAASEQSEKEKAEESEIIEAVAYMFKSDWRFFARGDFRGTLSLLTEEQVKALSNGGKDCFVKVVMKKVPL